MFLLVLAGLVAGMPAARAADAPPVIHVASVTQKNVPVELAAIGTVVPVQSVDIRSRIDSQITEIRFHDGDTVKQGDVLFVLDDRALEAQIDQLEANIARDQAQAENLKRQYDRAQSLFGKGFSTQQTADDAKAAFDAQTAAVAADKAGLENIQVQRGYARIEAPIAGRAGSINVTVGNTVKANDILPLVRLNQIAPIYVQSAFPQVDFDDVTRALKKGNAVAAAIRGESKTRETGKLKSMDNAVDTSTGTFATRAVFDNTGENLWPGMAVKLNVTIPDDNPSLVVPVDAVQHGPDGDYVFVIENGKAARRGVTIAREQDNIAAIQSGVKENETIAVDGFLKLEDGMTVAIAAPSGDSK